MKSGNLMNLPAHLHRKHLVVVPVRGAGAGDAGGAGAGHLWTNARAAAAAGVGAARVAEGDGGVVLCDDVPPQPPQGGLRGACGARELREWHTIDTLRLFVALVGLCCSSRLLHLMHLPTPHARVRRPARTSPVGRILGPLNQPLVAHHLPAASCSHTCLQLL